MEKLASKNLFWSLVNVAIVVAVVFGLKYFFTGGFSVDQQRLIMVSAEGEISVVPDIARISFSVLTEGKDPKAVQEENVQKMNRGIEFVKQQGIDSEDIKTSGFNLYPIYDYNVIISNGGKRSPFIQGYRMTQTATVKVRDFGKISDILGTLPGLGINQIDGVSFDVDEPDTYLNQAREEAFDKAYEKASAMAKMNGVRIRRVVSFSEGGGAYPRFLAVEAFGKGGTDSVPAPAPTIEPGSQEVTVNVSVTYEIR